MARTITIDGVDRTAITRLDSFNLGTSAFRGEVGSGNLIIDDPSAAITIDPLAPVIVEEDSSTPSRIFWGYTAERAIPRGPLVAGTQRQWDITIEDLNVLLDDRLIRGTGKRPEETDYARIQWLLGESALGSVIAGQVPKSNLKTMDPEDYRKRHARDVLEDCSQRTGKNFYVYTDGTDKLLYYDKQVNAPTSPISVSSVLADIDGATVFGPASLEVKKDPERKYDRVTLVYDGGTVTSGRNPGGRVREKRVINKRIKTRRAAMDHLRNMLTQLDSETVLVGLSMHVPKSVIGDIRAGQKIPIKLPHAGIAAYTNYKIANVQIGPRMGQGEPTDVEYTVRLRMADEIRPTHVQSVGGPGGSGGGTPDDEKDPSGPVIPTIDLGEYVLDDFIRPALLHTVCGTLASATEWDVPIPDGSIEGMLLIAYVSSDHEDLDPIPTGWTLAMDASYDGGTAATRHGYHVLTRVVDGTEGYDGIGDTVRIEKDGSADFLDYWVAQVGGAGTPLFEEADGTSGNADPPLSDIGPASIGNLFIALAGVKGSNGLVDVTAVPSGYTEDCSHPGNVSIDGRNGFGAASKWSTATTDNPGTFTNTSKNWWAATIMIPAAPSTLGFLPIPAEGASWEGANQWYTSSVGASPVWGTTASTFFLTANNIDDTVSLVLYHSDAGDSPDGGSGIPGEQLPSEASSWTALVRFRIDVAGDPAGAGTRFLEFTSLDADGGHLFIWRVQFGDLIRAEGIYLWNRGDSIDVSDFTAKSITEGQWMLLRMQRADTTARAKMWLESAVEPTDWDLVVESSDTWTGEAPKLSMAASLGNPSGPTQTLEVDWIKFGSFPETGQSVVGQTVAVASGFTNIFQLPFVPVRGTASFYIDGILTPPASIDYDAFQVTFFSDPSDFARITWDAVRA